MWSIATAPLAQVPIITSKHKDTHDTTSLWACMKGVPKKIAFHAHPITLAFAVTDFKLQGKTLDKLILSIAPRPFPPHLDLKAFYVMVSRVRGRHGLRVLHRPAKHRGGLLHVLKLKHAPALKAWDEGYNESGDWDPLRPRPPPVGEASNERAPRKRQRRKA